jgi:steroid delta-isomerase-like uncharacterized protein
MSSEDNVAVVHRFIDEVLNGGRLELVPELWANDLAWHGGSLGDVVGRDAYTQMLGDSVSAFRDLHLTIRDVIVQEDKVVIRFTNGGRSAGPFLGAPATGERIEWEGIGIYLITNGRISEAWFSEDLLAVADKLGVIDLQAESAG